MFTNELAFLFKFYYFFIKGIVEKVKLNNLFCCIFQKNLIKGLSSNLTKIF